jgi:hypothetical protein
VTQTAKPKIRHVREETTKAVSKFSSIGAALGGKADEEALAYMRARQLTMRRSASMTDRGSVQMATSRPRDPMWYWRQNNLPIEYDKEGELKRVREFCRLLYITHPIVSSCIDIFSEYPMQGMRMECKSKELEEFYSELFFDQLDYETHLLRVGREYWKVGEAFTLGGWNETLGVWESDQLINPDDVELEAGLFLNEPRYLMKLPDQLKNLIQSRSPRWQYEQLRAEFPELLAYANQDEQIPVSPVLMKHMKFDADDFSKRGIPILMRGFRTLIQEEMLNSALDSIADRLYTPLILTKLGATAQQLGTSVPWIPNEEEMESFNLALDAALAADFRALTYHWAIDMQPVFGRENVPDLSNDFDRITERLLMVFGLSQTMLTGANAGETYAADALNRDVVSQRLSHYQRMHQRFVRERMLIVAEAQEHFDYDVRGGKRYLVTEEVLEQDEESGELSLREQPKLLVPELKFATINLTDETQKQQWIEQLAEAGIPLSYRARIQGTGLDLDEMAEQRAQEQIDLQVADVEVKRNTYKALNLKGLPVPEELAQLFTPRAQQPMGMPPPGQLTDPQAGSADTLGDSPIPLPYLAPTPDDQAAAEQNAEMAQQEEGADVPPESNEQRKGMPKAAERHHLPRTASMRKLGIKKVTAERYQPPVHSFEDPDTGEIYYESRLRDRQPDGKFGTPKHVGMLRYVTVPEELTVKGQQAQQQREAGD